MAELVEAFDARDEVAALELNVSCPNVKTGLIMGADPHEITALLERVRPLTAKPLIVKLTPNASDVAAVARAAEAAGAAPLSLINTVRGMALDPRTGEPWLGGGTGGVSGPAVRAVALAQVHAVAAAVGIPIVGMGGVGTGRDALDLLRAGATWWRSEPRASATRGRDPGRRGAARTPLTAPKPQRYPREACSQQSADCSKVANST